MYLKLLKQGRHKLDILQALANSPEGRSRDVRLAGLDELLQLRKSRMPLYKRLFS